MFPFTVRITPVSSLAKSWTLLSLPFRCVSWSLSLGFCHIRGRQRTISISAQPQSKHQAGNNHAHFRNLLAKACPSVTMSLPSSLSNTLPADEDHPAGLGPSPPSGSSNAGGGGAGDGAGGGNDNTGAMPGSPLQLPNIGLLDVDEQLEVAGRQDIQAQAARRNATEADIAAAGIEPDFDVVMDTINGLVNPLPPLPSDLAAADGGDDRACCPRAAKRLKADDGQGEPPEYDGSPHKVYSARNTGSRQGHRGEGLVLWRESVSATLRPDGSAGKSLSAEAASAWHGLGRVIGEAHAALSSRRRKPCFDTVAAARAMPAAERAILRVGNLLARCRAWCGWPWSSSGSGRRATSSHASPAGATACPPGPAWYS